MTPAIREVSRTLPLRAVLSTTLRKVVMETIATSDIPAFVDDLNFDGLDSAVGASLDYYRKLPASKMIAFGEAAYPASHLVRSLEHFLAFVEITSDVIPKAGNRIIYTSGCPRNQNKCSNNMGEPPL